MIKVQLILEISIKKRYFNHYAYYTFFIETLSIIFVFKCQLLRFSNNLIIVIPSCTVEQNNIDFLRVSFDSSCLIAFHESLSKSPASSASPAS